MELFYIGILWFIAYLVSEQIDENNWRNLRKHYKELREKENKKL